MKYLIANWKMNSLDISDWILKFENNCGEISSKETLQIVICPNFLQIPFFIEKSAFSKYLLTGSQDVSEKDPGPFTGQVSSKHLSNFSEIHYCIVGHSEQRMAGDTNSIVFQKTQKLINEKISPIVCVGESLETKESGDRENFLFKQLESFSNFENLKSNSIIIAYEPIWAIGTGISAEISSIRESIDFIKATLETKNIQSEILYGGSVNATNSKEILAEKNISGLLVGNASLDGEEFAKIAQNF